MCCVYTIIEHKPATPEQSHDLLTFQKSGQEAYEGYVKYRLLGEPSTETPVRKKRLLTFSITQIQKKRIKQVEKEQKISQRFLKRQLAWASENNHTPSQNIFCQISTLPRAIVGKDGLPYKSNKSSTMKYLRKRYKHIMLTSLPWTPTSVILEGMFMIQAVPCPTTENMKEYAQSLCVRYIKPHFKRYTREVHVVFDNPGSQTENPKEMEQCRRDAASAAELEDHECMTFESGTEIPKNWSATLACRKCKAALTRYLAKEFLRIAPNYMRVPDQEFFTNIKGTAYSSDQFEVEKERPSLSTNLDEADMPIWLRCVHCTGSKILIFSPDTDVYHIGLPVVQRMPHNKVVIQLSKSLLENPTILDMNALLLALDTDPDLCDIPPQHRPQALQTLYACTGCDYISYFAGIGKCTFLTTFFQYASFISAGLQPPGSLGVISLNHCDPSLLSFLRLVGCAYFKVHASAFEHRTPVSLYHSVLGDSHSFGTHAQWLDLIRKTVWLRADNESKTLPTTEALELHWYRCLWVLGLWHSSTNNNNELPCK